MVVLPIGAAERTRAAVGSYGLRPGDSAGLPGVFRIADAQGRQAGGDDAAGIAAPVVLLAGLGTAADAGIVELSDPTVLTFRAAGATGSGAARRAGISGVAGAAD